MSLRGELEDLSVAEILHVVGAARRSGLLRLTAAETADILFNNGTVVALRGAEMPASLVDLLLAAGVIDADAAASAVRTAAESGRAPDDVLLAGRAVPEARIQNAIETEIERRLPRLLGLASGRFEFSLLHDAPREAADFGHVVLAHGIPVARLGAKRGQVERMPADPEGETTGSRRARLLVDEDAIALPGQARAAAPAKNAAAPPPAPAPTQAPAPAPPPARAADAVPRRRPGSHTVLHGLDSGPLRQGLLAALNEAGAGARALGSLHDVRAGVEAARARGESVVLACHAGHAAAPGLEVLARLRSVDASTPAALLLDSAWPPAHQSAVADRARRLGVRLLALLPDDGADAAASDLAERLLSLAEPAARDGAIHALATEPSGPGFLAAETVEPRARRDEAQLSALARRLAAAGEAAEIACELLAACGEQFDRALLFVRGATGLELAGAALPAGTSLPEALTSGRALAADGADFLAACVREGSPYDGPPPSAPADAPASRALGLEGRARTCLLPLLASGGCFGVIVADDSVPDGSGDLATLSRFVMETAPSLWEALSRERRRTEARRLRASA